MQQTEKTPVKKKQLHLCFLMSFLNSHIFTTLIKNIRSSCTLLLCYDAIKTPSETLEAYGSVHNAQYTVDIKYN